MARKPNYRFERQERDRQKALKKAARLASKQEKVDARKAENEAAETEAPAAEAETSEDETR